MGTLKGNRKSRFQTQKAKKLQTVDPKFHNYVGQVGYWLPWDPTEDRIENQEYAEGHLNTMMKKYNENREMREEMFRIENERKREEAEKKAAELKNELNQASKEDKDVSKQKISELREMVDTKDSLLSGDNDDKKEDIESQSSDNLKKIVKDLF